jgi:hypothetical protein
MTQSTMSGLFMLYCEHCSDAMPHDLRLDIGKELVDYKDPKKFNTIRISVRGLLVCIMCETTWEGASND